MIRGRRLKTPPEKKKAQSLLNGGYTRLPKTVSESVLVIKTL